MSTKEFIQDEIANHDVVIFSKSYCPYCSSTKQLFKGFSSADVTVYELDKVKNGADIQRELQQITGQRTVPNVFVKGQHLGGNDDTQDAARSGRLAEMLKNTKH